MTTAQEQFCSGCKHLRCKYNKILLEEEWSCTKGKSPSFGGCEFYDERN